MTLNISSLSVTRVCRYQDSDAVSQDIRGFILIDSLVFKMFFLFHGLFFFFLSVPSCWVSMQKTKGMTKTIT